MTSVVLAFPRVGIASLAFPEATRADALIFDMLSWPRDFCDSRPIETLRTRING